MDTKYIQTKPLMYIRLDLRNLYSSAFNLFSLSPSSSTSSACFTSLDLLVTSSTSALDTYDCTSHSKLIRASSRPYDSLHQVHNNLGTY